ncbi:SusC/RagA family TonB-linked outer membrane protein [Flammeovirgaceae bacterium SG7u.111]|nr:SusC/RagA family TonB-linked outer membrane protein [Flammeovirgaceae bacterium SG7u.132]WPO33742.1 SusC/RagA family TonB-linked outer membrane protein [Flammeovirgaceae bacterium SG7u.111]
MKSKRLRQVLRMSRQLFFIVFLQLLLCGLLYAENGVGQKRKLEDIFISIELQEATLKDVFHKIHLETDLEFTYNHKVVNDKSRLSLSFIDESLENILGYIAKEKKLKFKRINENIHVNNYYIFAPTPEVTAVEDILQMTIKGKVTSAEDNEPLPGVNIIIKGTSKGTTTGIDGDFSLQASSEDVLLFSYIGFLQQEIAVGSQSVINVVLESDLEQLEEVVVIGYGTVKKSDLTGSVASIKSEDITSMPTNNVLESMQGKISGMDLVRESGQVGSAIKMTVRGNRSLTASNSPLILVDGVAYGADVNINPNDVESIEVLKDASSTAIYGSRGANGVIMITTKKGKSGKPTVTFNAYKGVNTLTNYPSLTNTEQWVEQKREAYRATGVWNSPADDATIWTGEELDRINRGISTDWYDVIYSTGQIQDYQVALTGGSEATKVSFSLNYYNEAGVLKNDELDRYNGRVNITQKINDKMELGASLLLTYSLRNERRSIFDQTKKMLPIGIPYNEDGSIRQFPFASTDVNPLMDEDENNYKNESISNRTFSTAYFKYEIIPNLVFNSNLGIDIGNSRQGIFEGLNSTAVSKNQGLSKAYKSHGVSRNITFENTLSYAKDFGKHSISALFGQSYLTYYSEVTSAEGLDLAFEQSQFHNLDGLQQQQVVSSSLTESGLLSYFTRLNYKFDEKYLLTFTMRADGSSVLGNNNKWGYFPSGAFAWRMSEEGFLSNNNTISNLKLRVSYGLSGNTAVSPYQSTGGLSKTIYAFEENAAYGYRPYNLANQDLKWEKTTVLNGGLDLGILSDRISGSIDVYKTWTNDLLMEQLIPSHTGYTKVISNVGKSETTGLDVTLSSVNIDKPDFSWNTDLTFSTNKEKITSLNSDQDDVANGWFIGQPTRVFYDYDKVGIWQLDEEALAGEYGQEPGDIKVRDTDDDGVITAEKDRIIIGQATPKWTAGLNNQINYKGFEFSFFMIARIGQTISSEAATQFYPSAYQNSALVDYWTPENPTNSYPRPNASKSVSNMLYFSSLAYRKGDFLKVKTITFGYNLQPSLLNKIGLDRVRVYCTAKNYLTFSEFDDYDPERGGSSSYPMTKQLVFGTNITF